MAKNGPSLADASSGLVLGIEGGGTRCTAALGNARGQILQKLEFGPANLRLLSDPQLRDLFKRISRSFSNPAAIGIGLAGLRTPADHARVSTLVKKIWPGAAFRATHDLELALLAAPDPQPGYGAQVLVLSGTGSCCYGRSRKGVTVKMGGWGHILGDKGSGYEISLRALKACVFYYDRDSIWSRLGQRLLRALALNEPEDLVNWALTASKTDIAALVPEVFAAGRERDQIARDVLKGAAHSLCKDALAVAKRLSPKHPIEFVFAGSVLAQQPKFAQKIFALIREQRADVRRIIPREPTISGALKLAATALPMTRSHGREAVADFPAGSRAQRVRGGLSSNYKLETLPLDSQAPTQSIISLAKSPTERRNPRSSNLDQLPLSEAIRLMLSEEAIVPKALSNHVLDIEKAIRLIVTAFHKGGRLFYIGAGTSGRLGVLDASECPPTFSVPPDQVQGIIAGGQRALWQSVEGAEDNSEAGAQAIKTRGVRREDVVVGIAASGRTPFVWGALRAAKQLHARTILICFNPEIRIPAEQKPNLVLAVNLGPEVLTGSTRLKAGTATKLLLNLFTTLSMVRMGKVVGNLMIDLNPSNVKLRDRAIRIVRELRACDSKQANAALERTHWNIKKALKLLGTGFL